MSSRIEAVRTHLATRDTDAGPVSFCFVEVVADDGTVGWGEACDSFGCTYASVVAAAVHDAFAPLVVGEEVGRVDVLADRMRLLTRRRLGEAGIAAHARSAVELALWDLAGQRAGAPVSALLGRVRDRVEVYASCSFLETGDVDHHVAQVAPLLERGVRRVKVRTGPDWEADLVTLAGLREALPDVELMVDGSETYTVPTALRIADRLAALGVAWFEEPVPQPSRPALEDLGARSPVPIAVGEHLFGREDALAALRGGWAAVLQPDAASCGGLGEARRMAELGASFGARVVPHNCAGPVAFAANLHLCASVPGIRLLEYPLFLAETWTAFGAGEHLGPAAVVDGCLPVPDGPGLGVPLDLDALTAAPYRPPGARVAGTRQGLPDRFLGDV